MTIRSRFVLLLALSIGFALCSRFGPIGPWLEGTPADPPPRPDPRTASKEEFLPFGHSDFPEGTRAVVPGGAPLSLQALVGTFRGEDDLEIRPDGTWECRREWGGCIRSVDIARGTARVQRGMLRLVLVSVEGRPTGRWCDALPVWWGDRLYLLGAEDVGRFCNAVNWGTEPREQMYLKSDTTLVRDLRMDCHVDEPAGDGPPLLPAPVARWILPEALEFRLVSRHPDGSWKLDGGSRAGAYPGMRLALCESADPERHLMITTVSEDHSVAMPDPPQESLIPGTRVRCEARGARFAMR